MLRKILIMLSIILVSVGLASVQLYRYSTDTSLNDWHEGVDGYVKAIREQRESGKPILVFFYTDWCSNCRSLRENVLADKEVKLFLENIIPVKINPENGVMEDQLAKEFEILGYPSLFFVTPSQQSASINGISNIKPELFIKKCKLQLSQLLNDGLAK